MMVCVELFIMLVFIKYRVLYFSGFCCSGLWLWVIFFIGSDLLVSEVWVMNKFCVCRICRFVGIIFFVDNWIMLFGISWLIGSFSQWFFFCLFIICSMVVVLFIIVFSVFVVLVECVFWMKLSNVEIFIIRVIILVVNRFLVEQEMMLSMVSSRLNGL